MKFSIDTVILAIELVGVLSFAASGAMTGLRKNMDLFGVCILGLTTAVGGGVLRDVILGSTPPATRSEEHTSELQSLSC